MKVHDLHTSVDTKHGSEADCASVQAEDMSDALKQDFQDFLVFCTKRQWAQQHEPIAPVTANKYVDHLR